MYNGYIGRVPKNHRQGDTDMKKILSLVLVCAILTGCLFTLASCGNTISGSYTAELEILGQSASTTYKFSGKKVEIITKTTILGTVNTETESATYSINGDEITITKDDADKTYTFEKGDDYIKIAGIQYTKD